MSTNGSTSRGVRTLTAAGLVAVVGALVLGILGMHGLTQHGAAPAHSSHPPVAAVSADPHAAHPAPDHQPVTTEAAQSAPAATPTGPGSSNDHGTGSDMVMLCAAMLLAAAAGVLLGLRRLRGTVRTPRSLRPLLRLPAFAATARVGTGPPGVWEFSVVRC